MALTESRFLLLTDDEDTRKSVTEALSPVSKLMITCDRDDQAVLKAQNQDFDAFLLRTKVASLKDPKRFFQWVQGQKAKAKTPWIVLGRDIEAEDIVITHRHVKFVDNPKDGLALIKLLEGVLFSSGQAAKLDVNFINPLVGAVVNTLQSMASVELKRGTPFVRKPNDKSPSGVDITGLVAMNSDRFLGSLAISFEETAVLHVYEKMLGQAQKTISDDVKDCVAEISNIIFGHAKKDLNEAGHTIFPAIPSIVTGKNHEIRHNVQGTCLVIPFETSAGRIVVECVISPKL
jgi:chemotaxis protein CheX